MKLAGVLLLVVLSSASATAAPVPTCRTAEYFAHDEAVFGHFARRSAASGLAAKALHQGFRGIKIEDDGCGDYEVEIDGADTTAVRTSFAAEAAKAKFQVTFEQRYPPLAFHTGDVIGILGEFRSLKRANGLATRLAAADFRYIDVGFLQGSWAVVMPEIPANAARSLGAELRRAGFRVEFRNAAQ